VGDGAECAAGCGYGCFGVVGFVRIPQCVLPYYRLEGCLN
jgi:hypothetical protein